MKTKILNSLLTLSIVVSFCGLARGYPLTGALNPMQMVPAVESSGHGSCKGTQTAGDTFIIDLNCEFSGLSGGLFDANIGWAIAGQNGFSVCDEKTLFVTLPNNGNGELAMHCVYWIPLWEPPPPLKSLYLVLHTSNFPDGEVRAQIKPSTIDNDVDGDGRTEISLFRPSDNTVWSYCALINGPMAKTLDWRSATDSTPFLADFDGDGISDWTIIRNDNVNPYAWLWMSSRDNTLHGVGFGRASLGDIPTYGDFNGDGVTDLAVFRTTTGVWWLHESRIHGGWRYVYFVSRTVPWSESGGTPCAGDYDGDGKFDLCLVRPEGGNWAWYVRRSSDDQVTKTFWGLTTDGRYLANPVDVDGDGANDLMVSREDNGVRIFYALRSSDGSWQAWQWGLTGDIVKLGDYDGDAKTDFAAVREVDGYLIWYLLRSSDGQLSAMQWGLPGDR